MLGLDAGSKFVKAVRWREDFREIACREHQGKVEETLRELAGGESAVITGKCAPRNPTLYPLVDEIAAVIEAARYFECACPHIVSVGASSIHAIALGSDGRFSSYRENSLCAAGTGSFLDEQMHRMGFSYETIASLPFLETPPEIASRCAVFAKSDLIHRQQEGHTREALMAGLCRGVTLTMLHTAFPAGVPEGPILFIGGIFKNHLVRGWVQREVPGALFHGSGHLFAAIGAVLGRNSAREAALLPERREVRRAPLARARTTARGPLPVRTYILRENEVRIFRIPVASETLALGIDIGSTSTKAAIVSARGEVLADIYRKTGGDPLGAIRELFRTIRGEVGELSFTAVATTGSGRKLAGRVIGADLIVNEITAHFRGARQVDPGISTIIEIGGQDSKYIRGVEGAAVDCAMNFVCAAGTGSFIEEQAQRLGFDVREIGDLVMGVPVPHTSDRCTVFMEQDMAVLLRDGSTREEVMAGVLFSVAKNYLRRVVGTRPITGDRVFFQGATARNRALAAAFGQLLGKEVVVSPFCHIMGAWGAALLALERTVRPTAFRGLAVLDREVRLAYETCGECNNACTITVASLAGGEVESWGYRCGREPGAPPARRSSHFKRLTRLSRGRKSLPVPSRGRIGIPLVLLMHDYLPLWRTFFDHLGFEIVLQESTPAIKESAMRSSRADFCFPMKMALAHARMLEDERIDAIFFPTMISERIQENNLPRYFCPYVISYPSIVQNEAGVPCVSPLVDFRLSEESIVGELTRSLERFHLSGSRIAAAFSRGKAALRARDEERFRIGQEIIENATKGGGKAVVVLGRSYNLLDAMIGMGLPERFAGHGIEALPFHYLLPPDRVSRVSHMYWNYGELILETAERIREMPGVYPVYLTNFSCGPDSFLLGRFEKIMRGKPYLILELDEHGSETGYLTRIEAFMDMVNENAACTAAPVQREGFRSTWKERERKLWIPPMHAYAPPLFAAAFRSYGFEAEALPAEEPDAFELGRQGVRGSECLPACTTIGAFLKKLREINAIPSKHALFMPTTEGPCRFGQYTVLHRAILDKNGYEQTELFSPTSVNSYMGMPERLRLYLFEALLAADHLMKYVCRVRPYETRPGETDERADRMLAHLEHTAAAKGDLLRATVEAMEEIAGVETKNTSRPLVGIVGEIYSRCNAFCNNNLIRAIERCGGEAWLTPVTEWVLYTTWCEHYFARMHGRPLLARAMVGLKKNFLFRRHHEFEKACAPWLEGRAEPAMEDILDAGENFVPVQFEGEAILTLGRAVHFMQQGADLVVNCSPFGCMPGNITSAFFAGVQERYGKPVVTLFYDGENDVNRAISVYLANRVEKEKTLAMR